MRVFIHKNEKVSEHLWGKYYFVAADTECTADDLLSFKMLFTLYPNQWEETLYQSECFICNRYRLKQSMMVSMKPNYLVKSLY